MSKGDIIKITETDELWLDKPYGGLFGDTVQANVIEEIMADPTYNYRPKELEELVGASPTSVRKALNYLTATNILIKDESDRQHPVFSANLNSNRLIALNFLSYACVDDRKNSISMNNAIINHCKHSGLWKKIVMVSSGEVKVQIRRRVEEATIIFSIPQETGEDIQIRGGLA